MLEPQIAQTDPGIAQMEFKIAQMEPSMTQMKPRIGLKLPKWFLVWFFSFMNCRFVAVVSLLGLWVFGFMVSSYLS